LNYQSEYGVLPPAFDSTFANNPAGTYKSNGEAARHLRRLFPRCPDVLDQLNKASLPPQGGRIPITPATSLVSWLGGFTVDPTSPLLPPGTRIRLYDFDRARIVTETLAYHPAGSKDSPYLYVDAAHYLTFPYLARDPQKPENSLLTQPGTHFIPVPPLDYKPDGEPDYWYFTSDAAKVRSTEPFNADTFQILWAGRDGIFGTDDDLSNFWPGTGREYLDSLKAKK